ncbi:SNARE-binding exocyst subunit S6 [Cryptotrichosporon argae]
MTTAAALISEVLRQPDDLHKLSAYRAKLDKEKAALDAKLAGLVRAQLDATREGLLKLQEGRTGVGLVREEMIEVEKLKKDAGGGEAYDKISRVSAIHRNATQVSKMVTNLQSMSDRVDHLARLLASDREQADGPCGPSPNLLPIHYQLQQLEAFRNESLHQAKKGEPGDVAILKRKFEKLDVVGDGFEKWLWEIAGCIVELARRGNGGAVVRLLKIVEFEGKEDEKAVALRLVRKVGNTDAASKFKSMQANARVIKNYRHKLLDAMSAAVRQAFEAHYASCEGDLLSWLETLGWIYKDVIRIKDDVEPLFPADYDIAEFLVKAYHGSLNDVMRRAVDSGPEAKVLLELHGWIKEYRASMKELEVPAMWLQPPLLDGKSQDLIEDYVKLLVARPDEWTVNLMRDETARFTWRTRPPELADDGQFGMDGAVDFFQLVNQQADLALDSNQGQVLARVVGECARVMRRVQQEWAALLADEVRQYAEKRPDEVASGLQDYVMALANDMIKSADYTEALTARLEPLVSEKYKEVIAGRLNEAIDGYLDVAKRCSSALVDFVFTDMRKDGTSKLITPEWYAKDLAGAIVETMADYMANDYQAHLNPSIFDILVEDMLDAFLIAYLSALRRAPARALRMPAAVQRLRNDMEAAFGFFSRYKAPEDLEKHFEVIDQVVSMLGASSQMVFMDYWAFAKVHGPQLPFVEAILRARDDFDRVVVADIMDTLRRKVREEGITDPPEPTIMVKVQGQSGGLLSNLSSLANTYAGTFAERANNLARQI